MLLDNETELLIDTQNKVIVANKLSTEKALVVDVSGENNIKAGNHTRTTVGGSLAIGGKIIIKQLADGIAYNYIGD